jgi:hypothetical protein
MWGEGQRAMMLNSILYVVESIFWEKLGALPAHCIPTLQEISTSKRNQEFSVDFFNRRGSAHNNAQINLEGGGVIEH